MHEQHESLITLICSGVVKLFDTMFIPVLPLARVTIGGSTTAFIWGMAVPLMTGQSGFGGAPATAGGSYKELHHLPPQRPEYWLKFSGPAR